MRHGLRTLAAAFMALPAVVALGMPSPSRGQEPSSSVALDYGDDTGEWAHDGACDDNRFVGEEPYYFHWTSGEHNLHDASDCQELHEGGLVRLRSPVESAGSSVEAADSSSTRSLNLIVREAGELVVGEVERGRIRSGSSGDGEPNGDYWVFTGAAGQNVGVSVASVQFDPFVMLVSPDGELIEINEDGGVGHNSLILTRLPVAGEYHVVVGSFNQNGGAYEIIVPHINDLFGGVLVPGEVERGRIPAGRAAGLQVWIYDGKSRRLPARWAASTRSSSGRDDARECVRGMAGTQGCSTGILVAA